MSNLLKTALYNKHIALKAKMTSFGGWDMPIQYEGILKEHSACRENVAIFDTSHMGEFFFKGDIVDSGMQTATTIDLVALAVGKCKYGFLLNDSGGAIDDLIIYKIADDELMIVVNAGTMENDYDEINSRLNGVTLDNRSFALTKIDVQGPNSKTLLQPLLTTLSLDELKFFSFAYTQFEEEQVLVSRTGYTGELGFELYITHQKALVLWDQLIAKGATPAGLGARDVLRLEVGYSLYGNDLRTDITPLEANLAPFINLNREYYGSKALVAQKNNGVNRLLIPFTTTSRRSARKDYIAQQNGKEVGIVTSAAYSPILQVGIGLCLMNVTDFDDNSSFTLTHNTTTIQANKASLPFITK